VLLHPDGSSADVIMGTDVLAGQLVQYVIPAGVWQAGELVAGGRWALFGCTMAPGFTGTCFEGGRIGELLANYPDRAGDIRRLGIPVQESTTMPSGFAT
jgi:predicted cupin superfamily sugar epimerase